MTTTTTTTTGNKRPAASSAAAAVKKKKPTNIVIGKAVSSGAMSFRGADLTIHRFIGRVHPDVNVDSLKTDLENIGISVLDLQLNESKLSRFKSFHLTAKRSDAEKIDNPDTWPENVVVRRFFLPRKKAEDKVEQNES